MPTKEYYAKNREHILEQAKRWRDENKEKIKENRRQYYIKNREKLLAQGRKRKAVYFMAEENKEKNRKRSNDWYHKNIDAVQAKRNTPQGKERQKQAHEKYKDTVIYAAKCIAQSSQFLETKDVPTELAEAKLLELQIKRQAKTEK